MASDTAKPTSVDKTPARLFTIEIETHSRVEFKDVTGLIQKAITEAGVRSGVCHAFVPHTTAALLVNENYDAGLRKDFDDFLRQLAPAAKPYHHDDGNCDSHLKAALLGVSKTLLIEDGRLILGTWQGVFFCEFDGPRRRHLKIKILPD